MQREHMWQHPVSFIFFSWQVWALLVKISELFWKLLVSSRLLLFRQPFMGRDSSPVTLVTEKIEKFVLSVSLYPIANMRTWQTQKKGIDNNVLNTWYGIQAALSDFNKQVFMVENNIFFHCSAEKQLETPLWPNYNCWTIYCFIKNKKNCGNGRTIIP